MSEYRELSVRELMVKAMDIRVDSAPLLEEAQRRDDEAHLELTAVTGRNVTADAWTQASDIFWRNEIYEFCVAVRLKGDQKDPQRG